MCDELVFYDEQLLGIHRWPFRGRAALYRTAKKSVPALQPRLRAGYTQPSLTHGSRRPCSEAGRASGWRGMTDRIGRLRPAEGWVEIALAIPCVGARKAQRSAATRVSAGESKTGSRDLYHWIRERVGRSAQCSVRVGCSEVTDVGRCGPGAVPCCADARKW